MDKKLSLLNTIHKVIIKNNKLQDVIIVVQIL